MNETTFGREPVQVLELITPRCSNVHGSAPCTATETGDDKCYNTRASCNDPDNFQARPLAHLEADLILSQGETGSHSLGSLGNSSMIEMDVQVLADPDGVVFEIGGQGLGFVFVFDGGEAIFRMGGGAVTPTTGTAILTVPSTTVDTWIGRDLKFICRLEVDPGNPATLTVYLFDPLRYTMEVIGSASSTTDPGSPFGIDDYTVGPTDPANCPGGFPTGYNHRIYGVWVFDSQSIDLTPASPDQYRTRYFFDDGRKAKPSDNIYILPLLAGVNTVGSKINLTGSDERYEPLGRRAFLSASFVDAPHSGYPHDPYRTDRNANPLAQSTFWKKWLRREKFGKTRAIINVYSGYDGQRLADMRKQSYVVDRLTMQGEKVSLSARDFLSLTEFRRAQVPAPSSGKLDADMLEDGTFGQTIYLAGDVTDEYPDSGTLRIDEELMTYSGGLTYNSLNDQTEIVLDFRGTDGSLVAEHEADDMVQLCRRYTNATVDEVLEELLSVDAAIPSQVINLERIKDVSDSYLNAYSLTAVISEPTSVARLVGELAEQCSFYIWWDERSQIIEMQAISPIDAVAATLTEEEHILRDSFALEERPKERLTTVSFYYSPRNWAGDMTKPTNFKNQLLVSNARVTGPDLYGNLPQIREVFSRWLETESQANQTSSRFSLRYQDVPEYVQLSVDAKDRRFWLGDFLSISHSDLVDEDGNRDVLRRWLVIEASEPDPGHTQSLTLVDITLDGSQYYITENGIGNYTEELFAALNAFITDNNGLNSDGTEGAKIG